MRPLTAIAVGGLLLSACMPRPSRIVTAAADSSGGLPFRTIAVAQDSRLIGDLIAQHLECAGHITYYRRNTATLLGGTAASELSSDGLATLASAGVDAVLTVSSEYARWYRSQPTEFLDVTSPERASVRLVHTATGSTAASYLWENGHCQMRGSECDSGAKRSIIDAADEIAAAILGSPGPAPDRVIQSVEAGVLVADNTRFALPEPCPHFRANGKVRLAPAYPGRGCAVDRLLRRVHNLTLTCEVECSSVE